MPFAGIPRGLSLDVVKVLIPRVPQPGRSTGRAGTHSQADSVNPQPRQAVLVP